MTEKLKDDGAKLTTEKPQRGDINIARGNAPGNPARRLQAVLLRKLSE